MALMLQASMLVSCQPVGRSMESDRRRVGKDFFVDYLLLSLPLFSPDLSIR